MSDSLVKIYVDGSCRANGTENALGGIGLYLETSDEEKLFGAVIVDEAKTNNQAEYYAVIHAVEKAIDFKFTNILILSDSKLVVNQIKGLWAVRDPKLQELKDEVLLRVVNFKNFDIQWIPREQNKANDPAQNITDRSK